MKIPEHVPDRLLIGRKYFTGFILNDIYYCHGGIDSNGKSLNQFVEDKKLELESIDPSKLVRVIDCVGKPLSVNVIS